MKGAFSQALWYIHNKMLHLQYHILVLRMCLYCWHVPDNCRDVAVCSQARPGVKGRMDADDGHEQELMSLRLAMTQGGASALETAAVEMSQAAGALVAIEKHILELSEQKVIAFSQLVQCTYKRIHALIRSHICTAIPGPSTAFEAADLADLCPQTKVQSMHNYWHRAWDS